MTIINYDDPTLSRNINCQIFQDCSGRTITANGTEGLAKLTNHLYTREQYQNVFHWGIEATLITGLVSCSNPKYTKHAIIGAGIISLLYLAGKDSFNRKKINQ